MSKGATYFDFPAKVQGHTVYGFYGVLDTYVVPLSPLDTNGDYDASYGISVWERSDKNGFYLIAGSSFSMKKLYMTFMYI